MPKSKEFISSDSESGSGSDVEPATKKKKTEKKEKKGKPEKSAEKKEKKPSSSSSDEVMIQLARMRYASVQEFRGKKLVSIREYYEKDGDLLPGKKGISLTEDQWQKLKDSIPEIDAAL